MNIALDAMGGDNAPRAIVEGAILAKKEGTLIDGANVTLVGQEEVIKSHLTALGVTEDFIDIEHASEVVEMGEHPTKAISQKPDSSIIKGYMMLKAGKADCFISAGNTGAMLVGAMFTIKTIDGVIRPAIAGFIPKDRGVYGIIVDIGANADCKPDVLGQFGQMGYLYYKHVFEVDNPKVGLLNVGTEPGKGSLLTQSAFDILNLNKNINFIGNIEGRNVLTNEVDVVVSDGFSGNIVLKLCESMYPLLEKRGYVDEFVTLFDHSNVGGGAIVGVNGNVIIAHGDSNPKAVKNSLDLAVKTVKSNINEIIKSAYK